MKKLASLTVFFLLASVLSYCQTSKYWVASSTGNWNDVNNWSTSSGGTGGASVPSTIELAVFDSSGLGNCSMNVLVSIGGIDVQSGYTGVINQVTSNVVHFKALGAIFSGGTFIGGTGIIASDKSLSISGTNFTSTSGTLVIDDDYTFSSGTFNHNNGKVLFSFQNSHKYLVGSQTLFDVEFQGSTSFNIDSCNPLACTEMSVATILTVEGTLVFNNGTSTINSGQISVLGDIDLTLGNSTGSTILKIDGTTNQNIIGIAVGTRTVGNVNIDKPSGTLFLQDRITIVKSWTYLQGNIDGATNNSTIVFSTQPNLEIRGTHALYNVEFLGSKSFNLGITDVLTIEGTLAFINGTSTINNGQISVQGDLDLTLGNSTGSTILKIDGTANQSIIGIATGIRTLGNVNINKPSGTLFLHDRITIVKSWTYLQGNIDGATNNSTIVFSTQPNLEIRGTHALYNVEFLGSKSFNLGTTDVLTIEGTLAFINGTSTINNGQFAIKGDIDLVAGLTDGTTLFRINGTGNQTIFGGSNRKLDNLIIDKPSGIVAIEDELTVRTGKTLTLINGELAQGTNGLLIIEDNASITGGSVASYISVPIQKTGNDAFTFPTGKNGNYQPLSITAPTSSSWFTVEYFDVAQTLGTELGDSLGGISACEYWSLNRNAGTGTVDITIGWNNNSCDISSSVNDIRIGNWDGTKWVSIGNNSTTGTTSLGTITNDLAITNYTYFTTGKKASEFSNIVIDLGTAADFALLAQGEIKSNEEVKALRNVGSMIATDIKISSEGQVYNSTAEVSGALTDLSSAIVQIQSYAATSLTSLEGSVASGVYTINSSYIFDKSIDLNGNDSSIFIFKIDGDLNVTSEANVLLNNTRPKNIFWYVTGNVTIDDGGSFHGNLIADGNIIYNVNSFNRINLFSLGGEINLLSKVGGNLVGISFDGNTLSKSFDTSIGVCGDSIVATVQFDINATSVIIHQQYPDGIFFQGLDSLQFPISDIILDTTDLSSPIFYISNVSATTSFSFFVRTTCDLPDNTIITIIDSIFSPSLTVEYDAIDINADRPQVFVSTDIFTNDSIHTNNIINAVLDSVFERTICIVNAGFKVDSFIFNETHGSLLQIDSIIGVSSSQYNYDPATGLLSFPVTSDLLPNGMLARQDTFKITQLVRVVSCSPVNDGISLYTTSWGCNSEVCDTSNLVSAQVTTFSGIPELTLLHTIADTFCYTPSVIRENYFVIKHSPNSNGNAYNIDFDIRFDNTYTYTIPGTYEAVLPGSVSRISLSSSDSILTGLFNCGNDTLLLESNILFDRLNMGDSIIVYYQSFACTPPRGHCENETQYAMKDTLFYASGCGDSLFGDFRFNLGGGGSSLVEVDASGPVNMMGDTLWATLIPDTGGVTRKVIFEITKGGLGNGYWAANNPNRAIELRFGIAPCLYPVDSLGSSVHWLSDDASGNTEWFPYYSAYDASDNSLVLRYSWNEKPIGFNAGADVNENLIGSFININVKADCRYWVCPPKSAVNIEMSFVPDSACAIYSVPMMCDDWQINVQCPGCLRHGLFSTNLEMYRTNYGLADLDNNRIPDIPNITANPSTSEQRKAMVGDTVEIHLTAINQLSLPGANPTPFNRELTYGYYELFISGDANYTPLYCRVDIYDADMGVTYTDTIPGKSILRNTVISGAPADFLFEFSIDSLAEYGLDTSLYNHFGDRDIIELYPLFVITGNTGSLGFESDIDNHVYLGVIPYPSNTFDDTLLFPGGNTLPVTDPDYSKYDSIQYYCEDIGGGRFQLVGYQYSQSASIISGGQNGCTEKRIQWHIQTILSNGGFDNEFRNWAHYDSAWFVIPDGFIVNSVKILNRFVTPVEVFDFVPSGSGIWTKPNDTLFFSIEKWFIDNGYAHYYDDGATIDIIIAVSPTCDVPESLGANAIVTDNYVSWQQIPVLDSLFPIDTDTIRSAYVEFKYPDFDKLYLPGEQTALFSEVNWNFDFSVIQSAENVYAPNNWMTFESFNGTILITQVVIDGLTVLPQGTNNDIYLAGDIGPGQHVNIAVTAEYSNCTRDSILVLSGWDCQGVPDVVDSLTCISDSAILYINPVEAKLTVISPALTSSIDFCDSIPFLVEIRSASNGTMHDIEHTIIIPSGASLSSEGVVITYDGVTVPLNYTISNDTLFIDSLPLGIDTTGLLDSIGNYFVEFTLLPTCDYVNNQTVQFLTSGITNCNSLFFDTVNTTLPELEIRENDTLFAVFRSVLNNGCINDSGTVSVSILNNGSGISGNSVLQINVPSQVQTILNFSPDSTTIVGNDNILYWSVSSINPGDSAVISFAVFAHDSICGTFYLSALLNNHDTISCSGSGISCEVPPVPISILFCTGPALVVDSILQISCTGYMDGAAYVSVISSQYPYSYNWSNGETTKDILGLTTGGYTLTVTDVNGCTATQSVTITEEPLPLSVSSSSTIACYNSNDGSASVGVTGGTSPYTYLWSDGQSTSTASSLGDGIYTVTITDNNGCEGIESATITEFPEINISLTLQTHVTCKSNSDGSLGIMVNGGSSPYIYKWKDFFTNTFISGLSTATVTGLDKGTYYAIAQDMNGCSDIISVSILEPGDPLLVNILTTQNVSCKGGSDGMLQVQGSGGWLTYSYNWSNGENGAAIYNLTAGTYSYTVSDANSCSVTGSIIISEPAQPVTIGRSSFSNVTCFGGNDGSASISVSGGTSPYSYSWNNGSAIASIANLSSGNYSVTATDDNGCSITQNFVITQPTQALSVVATGTEVDCFGNNTGSATSSVSGSTTPYSYLWSSGQTSVGINNLFAGTHSVTVTDANNCTPQIATVTISQPSTIITSFSTTDEICSGTDGSATATVNGGTPPYTYSWSNGETSSTISGLIADNYSLVITDNNGCVETTVAAVEAYPTYITVTSPINTTMTWAVDMEIDHIVTIGTSGWLTIDNAQISFGPNGRIEVEAGGTLEIFNSTITNVQCNDELWQGIFVHGNQDFAHPINPFNGNNAKHGLAYIKNSTISNARVAVSTGAYFTDIVDQYAGIIIAENSQFINNRETIHIEGPTDGDNRSRIIRCQFRLNDDANFDFPFSKHIKFVNLRYCNGVEIIGNSFENQRTYTVNERRGVAVLSAASEYTLVRACNILNEQTNECEGARNTFTGMSYGVYGTDLGSLNVVKISDCVFDENFRGIYLRGLDFSEVTQNEFKVGNLTSALGFNNNAYGLYLDNCDDYTIEENEFENSAIQGTNYNSYGIVVRNSGAQSNQIYRNNITNLGVGMEVFGDYSLSSNEDLEIKCNDFYGNLEYWDFVNSSGDVADPQGLCDVNFDPRTPAGNTFSHTCNGIDNDNDFFAFWAGTEYAHHEYIGSYNIEPQCASHVTLNECFGTFYQDFETSCPTNFPVVSGGGSSSGNKFISINQLIIKNQQNLDGSVSIIDGGDTQALLATISTGSEGHVKNELLSASPYLSDEVLIAYTESEPPHGNFKQVIIQNSPVTEEVMSIIDEQNLPRGIKKQIDSVQIGVSPRYEIDQQINYYSRQLSLAYSDLTYYYLTDSIEENLDSVIAVLQTGEGDGIMMELTAAYTENEQYTEARTTMSNLDNIDFASYLYVQDVVIGLKEQNLELNELVNDNTIIAALDLLTKDTLNHGYVEARGLMELIDQELHYPEYFQPLPNGMVARKANNTEQETYSLVTEEDLIIVEHNELDRFKLGNYPNPFDQSTTIEVYSEKAGEVVVTSLLGELIRTQKIGKGNTFFTIDNKSLSSGTYFYTLIVEGIPVLTEKMVKY
ncbi:MAG: DUF3494 domain-containing protein [Flavobacteriales bacterium]|nr:DUF3494 domain-containing protein [Flavobacteriales bacterium]